MKTRHLRRVAAMIAATSLMLTACSSDEPDEQEPEPTESASDEGDDEGETPTDDEASGDGRVSTYIGQPESLTPTNNTESEGSAVLSALFTQLIEYDAANNYEPVFANAESITTDDNQTFTVTLRDGWTFHDGTPVTSASYVDAWNHAAYGPNAQSVSGFFAPIAGYSDMQCGTTTETQDGEDVTVSDCDNQPPASETLSGLEVVDDLTFTVTLEQAEPFFITRLGYNAYSPLPAVYYDDPDAYDRAPIGNGPFMMNGEWEDDVEIIVDAYPDYAGDDAAQIDGLDFLIYADVETAITDLIAGNLDIVDTVSPERWDEVTSQVPNSDLSPSSSINYIGFPTYAAPFDNPDMRAALSMAINREAITTGIFNGLRQPAYNMLSPVIPGYEENVCDEWNYNPELAAERFEAAGGLDALGDGIDVWFNEGGGHDLWMDAVITDWETNLGIPASTVSFQNLQFAEYLELADTAQFTGPFRLGWGMDYPHPQNYLQILLELTAEEGGNNATFYKDDAYAGKIAEALAVTDVESSLPVWQEANAIACAATPAAPMFYGQNTYAWNDGVSGVFVDAFGQIDYAALTTG